MACLMMQAPKKTCLEYRAERLLKAVKRGSLPSTAVLQFNEAGTNYLQAIAFRLASKNERQNLAIALFVGQKPPSASFLGMADSAMYATPDHDLEKRIALIEI